MNISASRVLHRWLWIVVLLIGVNQVVYAQTGYPKRADQQINDTANILNTETAGRVRALLTNLKSANGIEGVVVTINSIQDYGTGDTTFEAFATQLFNTWRIGSQQTNKGVLLLVAVKDRKVRIELGAGFDASYSKKVENVIDESITPAFKNGDYNRGIYNGVRGIIGGLTGTLPPDLAPQSAPAPSIKIDSQAVLWGLVILACVGVMVWRWMNGYPLFSGSGNSDSWSSHNSSSWSSSNSSSSSSSSDSGGHSDGGGASGSW